jgi:WD40 repeat protein
MRSPTSWSLRISLIALGIVAIFAWAVTLPQHAAAQPTKLPTVDEVKALQAKYKEEHDAAVRTGVAKRFIPAILDKAEELAKKSTDALAGGRLLQASEAIRQARWQLPYQPIGVPDHVSRIIGNLRLRHSGDINALAFSPDGLKLASASSDETVKIWDLTNGHEILTYKGHQSGALGSQRHKVRCLAWSNDGAFIASAGMEKNIKIWDPKTGKDIQSIPGVGDYVSSLALSKDGKHVFTGQINVPGNPPNGLFVYETQTGKLVRDLRDFTNRLGTLSLNNEGNILAAGDDNGNVRLFQYPSFVENANQPAYWTQQDAAGATYHLSFSPDDKTLVRVGPLGLKLYATPLPGAPFQPGAPRSMINMSARPTTAAYARDGKTIFTGDEGGSITLWSPDEGQKIGEYKKAHNREVNQLVFSPGGDRLASCSGDFAIRLFDFDVVLQSRDFEGHDGPVWAAGFSPDATRLVSAGADKTVRVWQRDTGAVLFTIKDHTAPVTFAMFSPDGKLIASAGGDKVVRIFDAATGKPLRVCEGHQGTITFLDFSADSKRIVSCGADRQIKIWDADTAKPVVSITDNPSIVAAVAFHPEGKQIAIANIDQTIRLYDAAGKMQGSWNAHRVAVNGVAYSPNGQWLASCGADNAVVVWPLATPGTNEIRLTGHEGPVSMVAFRKDNIHLVSCGADQLIKLWKIEGNAAKDVQTFRGHKDWVTSVAFSKDGFHVVSASVDRKLKIWEITSRELPLLAEHSSAVWTVAVSPNGEMIATGSVDRTIKLWNRKTGEEIATLTGHTGAVMGLVFTPDGKNLISAGSGGPPDALRLWEVSPPREIVRTPQQLITMSRLREKGYSPYIAVDPEGKTLFVWIPGSSASVKTIIEVHDWQAGTIRYEIMEGNLDINSLAFCANGKLCAAGAAKGGAVRLWDLGKDSFKLAPAGDWLLFDKKIGVADLALTPDGSTLVATSDEGEIKIGKVQGREVLKSFKGHEGRILACIISPDGKMFATVGADNVVKAWDLAGKELRRWDLGRHQGMFVISLAFSSDSKQIVTANANTTVYVLDLP